MRDEIMAQLGRLSEDSLHKVKVMLQRLEEEDKEVRERRAVSEHRRGASEVWLPAPVLGELPAGARGSGRVRENEERVWKLVRAASLVPCDERACRAYADIKVAFKAAGTPLPLNDIRIAACCLAVGAVVVSRDRHFDVIEGLPREEWR
jgi:predicted nucleic acid-binding protein